MPLRDAPGAPSAGVGDGTLRHAAVEAHARLADDGAVVSEHGVENDSSYWSGLKQCAADDVERLITRESSGLLTVRCPTCPYAP